jgi:hypothetical protein
MLVPLPHLGRNLFPLRLKSGEVFFPHPIQQVQWHSETTVSRYEYLACTTPQPASWPLSGAAKYPAGARPSKCIIIIIKTIEGKGKVRGRRGLERPPIEETRFKVYPEENVD